MRLTKLDSRWKGSGQFKYCVEYTYKDFQEFCSHRQWCWENWGASVEIEFYGRAKPVNIKWCWVCDNYRVRLYFVSDKEASHFTLRWLAQ